MRRQFGQTDLIQQSDYHGVWRRLAVASGGIERLYHSPSHRILRRNSDERTKVSRGCIHNGDATERNEVPLETASFMQEARVNLAMELSEAQALPTRSGNQRLVRKSTRGSGTEDSTGDTKKGSSNGGEGGDCKTISGLREGKLLTGPRPGFGLYPPLTYGVSPSHQETGYVYLVPGSGQYVTVP